MNWRDTAERVVWTVIAAILSALVPVLTGADWWWAGVALPIVNAALVWVRTKVNALPSPGEGLPGLPTASG